MPEPSSAGGPGGRPGGGPSAPPVEGPLAGSPAEADEGGVSERPKGIPEGRDAGGANIRFACAAAVADAGGAIVLPKGIAEDCPRKEYAGRPALKGRDGGADLPKALPEIPRGDS